MSIFDKISEKLDAAIVDPIREKNAFVQNSHKIFQLFDARDIQPDEFLMVLPAVIVTAFAELDYDRKTGDEYLKKLVIATEKMHDAYLKKNTC